MKKISRNSPILDGHSKNVLVDIAQQGLAGAGVNATYYRAQHGEDLDLLDKLERVGFLRKPGSGMTIDLCKRRLSQ